MLLQVVIVVVNYVIVDVVDVGDVGVAVAVFVAAAVML